MLGIYLYILVIKGNTAQSPRFALCTHPACIFSVILHKFSLAGVSPPGVELVQSDEKSDGAICTQTLCGVA